MDLNAVHMLIKVAEHKSFTQAAHSLGTTQSRISRAIAQLEADLGTRLLHRNTRNVSLTPDGCLLVDRSAELIAGLDDARQQLLDRRCEPTGVLRMTAPSVLGRMVLTPCWASCWSSTRACRSRPALLTAWSTWWMRALTRPCASARCWTAA